MRNAINEQVSEWPAAARIANDVGKLLQSQFGDKPIPGHLIRRQAERIGGYRRDSILPSDYCYNRVNRARISCAHPVFECLGRNEYRYLGPNFTYTGHILWKPVHESERAVGCWSEGRLDFTYDPRT